MRTGDIIFITENYKNPQLKQILFLVTKETDEFILLEDGTESSGHILNGYILVQFNGRLLTAPVKLSFLETDLKFEKVGICDFIYLPQVIHVKDINEPDYTVEYES